MAVMARLAYEDFRREQSKQLSMKDLHGFQILRSKRHGALRLRMKCGIMHWLEWLRCLICHHLKCINSEQSSGRPHYKTPCNDEASMNTSSCPKDLKALQPLSREAYSFQYWLFNWFEPTSVPGVNYHDTDLLVSTSRDNKVLVLTFAGTQSAADHVTNVQTFEPASHSRLFHAGRNMTLEGSLHRGFLNAYARVESGSVLRLCQNCTLTDGLSPIVSLHRRYSTCVRVNQKTPQRSRPDRNSIDSDTDLGNATIGNDLSDDKLTFKKDGGCRVFDKRLMSILRELVTDALCNGYAVHVSGHSQGGSLATLLALDIVINFPKVPISSFHLWTFGAPQVVDDLFLQSAIAAAPRLKSFLQKRASSRFHRFVTLSDDCEVDFVAAVTERALPTHQPDLRGKVARKFGGVRGSVVHLAPPTYILTPDQYSASNGTTNGKKTTTQSSVSAHSLINYLQGVAWESLDYPLSTDLPLEWRVELGEAPGA